LEIKGIKPAIPVITKMIFWPKAAWSASVKGTPKALRTTARKARTVPKSLPFKIDCKNVSIKSSLFVTLFKLFNIFKELVSVVLV
jgi:hypothetical protein